MNNLLDFLRRYSYAFLFVVLEALSFVLLFRFNSFQGSAWLSASNSAVAFVDRRYYDIMSFLQLKSVNRQLATQNLLLSQQNDALREKIKDLTRDTTITETLMAKRLVGFKLVPALVVSNSSGKSNNYIVIDKGKNDGIRPEMGVVGGGGVVGIVYLTGAHYSLVIPVTNRKSSISCRVRGERYFGYLQWGGQSMRFAYVDDIPRYARLKKGQVVETSGYSSVFPPGIFVGRISSISNSPDGQSYKLNVNLGTNFSNLRDVNVIATPYKAEIDTLRSHAAEADEKTDAGQ